MDDFDLSKINGFDWDQGNSGHIKKYNLSDKEAEEIFFNRPLRVNIDGKHSSENEQRFQALGKTNQGKELFVAFTIRDTLIRVISAIDINQNERRKNE